MDYLAGNVQLVIAIFEGYTIKITSEISYLKPPTKVNRQF